MDIYQHYRQDERPFIDQIFEWIQTVKETYAFKLTDFLDPRQQEIVTQIVNYDGEVKAYIYGGPEWTERKRAIISPDYFEPELSDFQLAFFELHYATKFFKIEHRQLLGALMSLGVKRDKFGDLAITEQTAQFIAANEMVDYITLNLTSVGKATVSVTTINEDELIKPHDDWRSFSGTITALRLDVLLSEIFRISRTKAVAFIQKGLVKINWKVVEQPSYECCVSDTISLRGYGRAKLDGIDGQTKKGKWRIRYRKK